MSGEERWEMACSRGLLVRHIPGMFCFINLELNPRPVPEIVDIITRTGLDGSTWRGLWLMGMSLGVQVFVRD